MLSWKRSRLVIRRALLLGLSALLISLASRATIPIDPFERATFFMEILSTGRYFEFTTDFYGLEYKGHSNELIDQYMLAFGGFEKPTLALMRDVMEAVAPGGMFVDIGANVGQHSLFMSKYAGTIHAFDPYQPVLDRFREMVEINNIKNIQIHPVGLGAEDATLPFFEPPRSNPGGGSFLSNSSDTHSTALELKIVEGDSYFAAHGIRNVDLIKADIEGYEKQAFKGLSRTIARDRPIVAMELTFGKDPRYQDMADVINSFPKDYLFFNYRQYVVSEEYFLSAVDASSKPDAGTMLVAIPKEKVPLVRMTNAE